MADIIKNALWGAAAVCIHVLCLGSFILCLIGSFLGLPGERGDSNHPYLWIACPFIAFAYIVWLQILFKKGPFLD